MSRNNREGHYQGKKYGRHRRNYPEVSLRHRVVRNGWYMPSSYFYHVGGINYSDFKVM